ncbi:basic proline-rich protein-like [Tympanuchus pallidicinctus]|uniref:basic proline-rich protein-like n=1 Tax=Tympanuchus pallidicinctus TaxID=109042 RepID=UPI002286E1F5|nr:basic proline-rich protein-like [Tympanuchus pallidicinctus]
MCVSTVLLLSLGSGRERRGGNNSNRHHRPERQRTASRPFPSERLLLSPSSPRPKSHGPQQRQAAGHRTSPEPPQGPSAPGPRSQERGVSPRTATARVPLRDPDLPPLHNAPLGSGPPRRSPRAGPPRAQATQAHGSARHRPGASPPSAAIGKGSSRRGEARAAAAPVPPEKERLRWRHLTERATIPASTHERGLHRRLCQASGARISRELLSQPIGARREARKRNHRDGPRDRVYTTQGLC